MREPRKTWKASFRCKRSWGFSKIRDPLGGVPVRRHIVWYLGICMHILYASVGSRDLWKPPFLFGIEI